MTETKELDMQELAKLLLKKAWLIVVCAILSGALVLGFTLGFVAPKYQASITIYVNNKTDNQSGSIDSADLAVALRLVTTYVNILKSDRVLEKVILESGRDLEVKDIREMLTAEPVEETEMFSVFVTTTDPKEAAEIANAIAAVAPEEIAAIIDGSTAKIIDYAKVPQYRHSPSYTLNTLIGVLAGGVLACIAIALQNFMDVRVRGEADLMRICPVPVIGMIPDIAEEVNGKGNGIKKWLR